MFVKTVKFNKKTAVVILIAAAAVLIGIILVAGSDSDGRARPVGSAVKTNGDRVDYLSSLGWEVENEPVSRQTVVLPRSLTGVLAEYNELQKAQGFDLSEFCGLELEMFSYRVLDYPNCPDTVYATLYVYNNRVVGGDVHSTALDGFMHGLTREGD